MSNIVEFKPKEKEDGLWVAGECICILCKHECVQTAKIGTVFMDCPSCGTNKLTWKYHMDIEDQPSWTCACGNQLFIIKPEGHLCPNCGTYNSY